MDIFELKHSRRLIWMFTTLLMGLWMLTPGWVKALPLDGNIVSGTGSFQEPSEQEMVIQQDSQRLITNWREFSIGTSKSVAFKQPDASAIAHNRVVGVDPSIILGKLFANGRVFPSNPSGVLFGKSSVVDVHGLLATTLNISGQDFLKDNYQFSHDLQAQFAVINDGVINYIRYLGLAAPMVENSGSIIVADLGSVALTSGSEMTLDFNGDGLISFTVTGAEDKFLQDRINHSGIIRANGGQVLLNSRTTAGVIDNAINHSGIIEVQTVQKNDLAIDPGNNPTDGIGNNDIRHISTENLILHTDGSINAKGMAEEDTAGINDSMIMNSGGDINFKDEISVFPSLNLFADNNVNVNVDITTTQGDFITVADSDVDGAGDFDVAPGVVVASARDIDVSGVNINSNEGALNATGDVTMNGNVMGNELEQPLIDNTSILQGSLGTFLTDFFQNGGSEDDC